MSSSAKPVVLVAAVAMIDEAGRVLLAERPAGKSMAGLWEFPGGKVEVGETPEDAVIREIREELGVELCRDCLAPFNFASHAYEKFHLLMPVFVCRTWEGEIRPREGQRVAFVRGRELQKYPLPPADLPLIPWLYDFLSGLERSA
jgi:8-oxo-dGTP diphosphatase